MYILQTLYNSRRWEKKLLVFSIKKIHLTVRIIVNCHICWSEIHRLQKHTNSWNDNLTLNELFMGSPRV